MTSTRTIEDLWASLRQGGGPGQQRIDAVHPHDIYADFDPPARIGIVVVCATRPTEPRPMRSLLVSVAQRADHRWSFRLSLDDWTLEPVFAALCADVITSTASGVSEVGLAGAVARRVEHWRALLERDSPGLGEEVLWGLIGELTVLEHVVTPQLGIHNAVAAWRGPLGAPQDFWFPDGRRIEVKAVVAAATSVRIHGLGQLDSAGDPLTLAVVRMQATADTAPGAITAAVLVERIRTAAAEEREAALLFDAALSALQWHDHLSHEAYAVRVLAIDAYEVDGRFPRLTVEHVPAGVLDTDYTVALPSEHANWLGADA